jgi:hypothetical protein
MIFFLFFLLYAFFFFFFFLASAVTSYIGIFDRYTHCKDSFVFFVYGTVKLFFVCLHLPR